MNVLEVKDLTKSYKKHIPVLSDFSISIPAGRIVGLLGPNGCGKSTLIKLISGLLQPDSGEILVDGNEIGEKTKAIISYLPERTYFNSWMKIEELVNYFEEFYADFDKTRALTLLHDLGIEPKAKLKSLSKGTKEKVQLILVMSRKAKLYLLDEPIAGVDPATRDYILKTIITNRAPDSTVMISTHLIADVEQVLDDVIFIKNGTIEMFRSAAEVRETEGKSVDELFREVYRW